MIELVGEDLFDQIETSDAICITTNCSISEDGTNPMGAGCAGSARRRWCHLPTQYANLLKTSGAVPVILGVEWRDSPGFVHSLASDPPLEYPDHTYIIAYPTMYSIGEPADLKLVVRSAILLSEMADNHRWNRVVIPRPGSGLGGLDWETEVKPALEPILNDRFVLIHKDFSSPSKTPYKQWMST